MKCAKHKDRDAVDICSNCGRGVCDECKVVVEGENFCKECSPRSSKLINPKKTRGYLQCDKCGGYYELGPEEASTDFNNKCNCGGTLKHTKNLNSNVNSNSGANNKNRVTENSLIDELINKLRIKVLISGGVICFVLLLIAIPIYSIGPYNNFNDTGYYQTTFLILFLSSIFVGYLLYEEDYLTVGINGAIIGLVPTFALLMFNGSMNMAGSFVTYLLYYLILGGIFGVTGAVIHKKLNITETRNRGV